MIKWKINRRLKTSRNKMGVKMLVFVTSKHSGAARFRGQRKTKRLYQLCVCVMWKRQCVPNTIPFSKGKTSISHTHTRCFAYFSKLRHTHTHWVSPPLAAALILGTVNYKTQSRFFLCPRWPSTAGLFWYGCEVKVAVAVRRLWLLAFSRTWETADLQRTYQRRIWRPTSHGSQRLSCVPSHFEHGNMFWKKNLRGRKDMTYDLHKKNMVK